VGVGFVEDVMVKYVINSNFNVGGFFQSLNLNLLLKIKILTITYKTEN
jgi:hypothetical protein